MTGKFENQCKNKTAGKIGRTKSYVSKFLAKAYIWRYSKVYIGEKCYRKVILRKYVILLKSREK